MTIANVYVNDKSFYRGLKYTALLSFLLLILYHLRIALTGWNPNNISFLTTFGLMCIVVLMSNANKFSIKIFYFVTIIVYSSILLQTGSRNGFLVAFVTIITIILYPVIKRPFFIKVYTIVTLSMPAIIPSIVSYIINSEYLIDRKSTRLNSSH